MKESSYAILGLGRYGRKLVTVLAATGADILIADEDRDMVNLYAEHVTQAVSLDMTNQSAIEKIGLENIDVAIVDMGDRLESSIMCIMIAKEKGVKNIIATARTDHIKKTLTLIGADEVVVPEDEAAVRMARRLISQDFMEYYDIGGGLCVIKALPKKEWTKKKLRHLNLPEKENVRIIAFEKEDGSMDMNVKADMVLDADTMVAMTIPKENVYDLV